MVSLFCYENRALPALLQSLADQPTLLLLTPGPAQQQVQAAPPGVRLASLPWLSQDDYDRLLWACDLNFVRGEDSLVRAIWAGRPFLWQIYPQHDGAQAAKLAAFLTQASQTADPPLAEAIRRAAWRWNGLPTAEDGDAWDLLNSPSSMFAWGELCAAWGTELRALPDLATQLMAFADAKSSLPQAKI